jgi:predicted dehydrogenase
MEHKILIYGGLGSVSKERIIPSLDSLRTKFSIKYATVDLKDTKFGKHYVYGDEPLQEYNSAIIATPNNTHASIAISALNSGLNILCEKPLSDTLVSAKQMLLVSQRRPSLISMLCDHYIYKPSIRYVIRNWDRYHKELGTIINIEARIFEQELQKGRDWLFFNEIAGGGIAMDTGFHIVSIMGKLFGQKNLTVIGSKMERYPQAPGDAETYASITLTAGQVPIHVEVGKWMGKVEKRILFKGNKATLALNIESGQVKFNGKIDQPITKDDCYRTLLEEFLSAIEEQRGPWTTLKEGYQTLKTIKLAYQIAGLGREGVQKECECEER